MFAEPYNIDLAIRFVNHSSETDLTITTHQLIEKGYFPKELPPIFSSSSLAQNLTSLPLTSSRNYSQPLRYSYSKYSSVHRAVSIPNPLHYIKLAEQVVTDWTNLLAHCNSSPLSKTAPKPDSARAITWRTTLDQLAILRAEQRVGARYVLKSDVTNFYGSVYTHAIPWALHSKAVAKADRSYKSSAQGGPPLYGNLLDLASRNIQSGQTIGIPIGPDTSIPIGEALLASVDILLANRIGGSLAGFRFVDDYELVFGTFTEAENARNILQDSLAEFELQLNPRKTQIIELPSALDTSWTQELSAFAIESPIENILQSQLIRYFSRAFELARLFPGDPVLKYAVRRIPDEDTRAASLVLQRLLFQTAAADPGTLQTALYVTYKHKESGRSVDKQSLERALSAILCRHSGLQHGGDIAWALWGAIVFDIKLSDEVADAIEKVSDPIAVLMALFAESQSIFSRTLQKSQWTTMAQGTELFESTWLVAYEAFGHGWLPSLTVDPANSDPFFEAARKNRVQFMDLSTNLDIPSPSPGGVYA